MIQASIEKMSENKLNTHQINVVEWVRGESEPFIELESLLIFYPLVDPRLVTPLCLQSVGAIQDPLQPCWAWR